MVVIRLELVYFHHKNICSTYTAKSYLAEEIFVKLISFHTARQMQYLLFGVGGISQQIYRFRKISLQFVVSTTCHWNFIKLKQYHCRHISVIALLYPSTTVASPSPTPMPTTTTSISSGNTYIHRTSPPRQPRAAAAPTAPLMAPLCQTGRHCRLPCSFRKLEVTAAADGVKDGSGGRALPPRMGSKTAVAPEPSRRGWSGRRKQWRQWLLSLPAEEVDDGDSGGSRALPLRRRSTMAANPELSRWWRMMSVGERVERGRGKRREERKVKKKELTARSHMQLGLTEILTDIVIEWHSSNFLKFQRHIADIVNSNGIFVNQHICNGIDPINPSLF